MDNKDAMLIKTAVVILNWNGLDMLKAYLPSVVAYSQSEDCKVYVIDNASTDASVSYVEAEHPTVGVVRLDRNHGFAGGYDIGLAGIDARYYILLNSDVRVTDGWLKPLVAYMDSHPHVAACQPKILSERDHGMFEYAGACGGYIDRYGYPFCRGRIFSTIERDEGQYDSIADISWASGAALAVRSDVFRHVGGFDETFFAHMEEIDLCWRIRRAGHAISCVPSSVVYHVGGATLGQENPYKTYLNFRNNLIMLRKNLPPRHYHRIMAVRALLDGIAALQFLLTLQPSKAAAVCRARIDYWHRMKDYKRLYAMAGSIVCYRRSIVCDYYLHGRKKFSRLFMAWQSKA